MIITISSVPAMPGLAPIPDILAGIFFSLFGLISK